MAREIDLPTSVDSPLDCARGVTDTWPVTRIEINMEMGGYKTYLGVGKVEVADKNLERVKYITCDVTGRDSLLREKTYRHSTATRSKRKMEQPALNRINTGYTTTRNSKNNK
jgi:hypothetical protein